MTEYLVYLREGDLVSAWFGAPSIGKRPLHTLPLDGL